MAQQKPLGTMVLRAATVTLILTLQFNIACEKRGRFSKYTAEAALNEQWLKATDTIIKPITVTGVREIPAENSAIADLEFNDFPYRSNNATRICRGPGSATFVEYNDGTWVLKKVSILGGNCAFAEFSPDMKVK